MSVKGKVKRLNREVKDLNDEIEYLEYKMECDRKEHREEKEMLESLIKFFVVNQVGKPAPGGVQIEKQYVDKLESLNVKVYYELENKAYVINLKEVNENAKNEEFI